MAAPVVTMALLVLLVLVMAPAAITTTLNSQWPELLPQDCGWRALESDHLSVPRIVGNGNTTADYGQFPWQARIVVSQRGPVGYRHRAVASSSPGCTCSPPPTVWTTSACAP